LSDYIRKNISITKEDNNFIKSNYIDTSKLLRITIQKLKKGIEGNPAKNTPSNPKRSTKRPN